MTTDKALEILGMSEQARWRSGYEPTDEKEAIETIREALEQSERYKKAIEEIKADIEPYEYEDKYECVKDDMTGWILAIDVVKVIDKHIKGEVE